MKATVIVSPEICKGCALCTTVCPKKIMELDMQKLNAKGYHTAICTDTAACIACAMCSIMCPDSAIAVNKEV